MPLIRAHSGAIGACGGVPSHPNHVYNCQSGQEPAAYECSPARGPLPEMYSYHGNEPICKTIKDYAISEIRADMIRIREKGSSSALLFSNH